MDPVTVATGVVAALVPYLAAAGTGLATKAGEATFAQCGKLWALLRNRLTGTVAQGALEDLHAAPSEPDVQGQARLQLRKALTADPDLTRELMALLPAAETEARQAMQVTGNDNTSVQAANSTVTITKS
ncbi:MAG: hypothetical protein HWD60_09825 [Defluviicoccus sp.]|nr:MAG: hypothetical protein HWD60_09825 [Defluviicoccus sp.]